MSWFSTRPTISHERNTNNVSILDLDSLDNPNKSTCSFRLNEDDLITHKLIDDVAGLAKPIEISWRMGLDDQQNSLLDQARSSNVTVLLSQSVSAWPFRWIRFVEGAIC